MTAPEPEPASFRDPDSRVFYSGERVYRALSARGAEEWRAVSSTDFFRRLTAEGAIVATEECGASAPLAELGAPPALILRHERMPFVSYPYEWTFAMLRDAALSHLDLVLAALDEGFGAKDASPYNMQWRGTRPVFVDVGSLERLRPGEPWAAYRQFCMSFLYPLLLQARRGVDFQPWLRGRLGGITPEECARLLSPREVLRRGLFTHVYLHARLDRRYASRAEAVRSDVEAAGFRRDLIRANVRGLRKLVGRLEWRPSATPWSEYRGAAAIRDDASRKEAFIRAALGARRPQLVWDLGCNDGFFSRAAAEYSRYVVAIDSDHAVVDALYRSLRADEDERVLPLVVNLADPSPRLGWLGTETRDLVSRGRPELVLCLALVHHLSIVDNVPVRAIVEWLAGLRASAVVEFPTPDDPLVQRLLERKRPGLHADYERAVFERHLSEAFAVERTEVLPSGTRVLYHVRPVA